MGRTGRSNGAWRGIRAAAIFVLGVAVSAVVNIVTSLWVRNSAWLGLRWVLLAVLAVLAFLGAVLSWRHDREVPRAKSPAGRAQVIENSYGPVVGEISGGNTAFYTDYEGRRQGREDQDA